MAYSSCLIRGSFLGQKRARHEDELTDDVTHNASSDLANR